MAYAVQQTNEQLELLGDIYDSAPYGYVVPLDETEFGQVLADALTALIEDGTYAEILEKWGVEAGAIDDPRSQPGRLTPPPLPMSADSSTTPAPPEQIRAVPVRHPGRWVAAAVIAVLAAMFVHMLVTNPVFQWDFMVDNMFSDAVLRGARTTLIMTVLAMVIGVLLGIVLAVMRLSANPIVSGAAWVYIWFFRAIPRIVLLFFVANLGALYARYEFGFPFDQQLMDLFGFEADWRLFGFDGNEIFVGFIAGLIGLALSEGAYMAEIVRAGIQSVDPGQAEAAQAWA